MTLAEVVFVVVVALVFILLSYLTKRIKPKAENKSRTLFIRIFMITAGILFLVLIWVGAPSAPFYLKALLSWFPIFAIYDNLKGWLFGVES